MGRVCRASWELAELGRWLVTVWRFWSCAILYVLKHYFANSFSIVGFGRSMSLSVVVAISQRLR